MKKGIGVVVAIVAVVLWKFVIGPQVEVSSKNAFGSGWDDAKNDILTEERAAFEEGFAGVTLPHGLLDKMANCTADKAIAFLNTTECSYLYNPSTTSEQEHLENQDKCLAAAGYEAREEQFTLECLKGQIPDDWSIMKEQLKQGIAEGFVEEGMVDTIAKPYADCVVPKLIALMQKRKCPLINKNAQKAEDFMFTTDECFKDPENDKEFDQLFESCVPAAKAN